MGYDVERLNLIVAVVMGLVTLYEVNQRQAGYGQPGGQPLLRRYQAPDISWDKLVATASALEHQRHQQQQCRMEHNAEYEGRVIKWGGDHLTDTAEECCHACQNTPECNIWVWCGRLSDCAPGRHFRECWLKRSTFKELVRGEGFPHELVGWTSGGVFDPEIRAFNAKEDRRRLLELAMNPMNPLVFLDVGINNLFYGRVYITLFGELSPLATENFRQLCTGEHGVVQEGKEGAGNAYHLKGAPFYRIIDKFTCQAGIKTDSVYGDFFADDAGGLKLHHNRTGLLSMANTGPKTNSAHFSILMAPAPQLDNRFVIFGEVISGIEAMYTLNGLARGRPDGKADSDAGAVILDSGEVDRRKINLTQIVTPPLLMRLNPHGPA